jgi:transcriptional regulator with XRE-family HTH domain
MKKPSTSKIEQHLIDKVREIRKRKKISQVKIADHLGVSKGFVGNVENPRYRAKYSINHLNAIAKLLKCSPKDFWPEQPI